MSGRRRLRNRRASTVFNFQVAGHRYVGSFGVFETGAPAELFVNSSKLSGSESDCNASDAAVAVSLALQYGCTIDELREAMKRNDDGSPQGPIGGALDAIAAIMKDTWK